MVLKADEKRLSREWPVFVRLVTDTGIQSSISKRFLQPLRSSQKKKNTNLTSYILAFVVLLLTDYKILSCSFIMKI